jgi:hypothetical protein
VTDTMQDGPRWWLRDEEALFNPVFVAALIAVGADAHRVSLRRNLPLELAVLLPLLTLPAEVRRLLPGSVRPYLNTWLDANPSVRPTLTRLAPAHAPLTRRALRFGVRHDLLNLEPDGLAPGPALKAVRASSDASVREVFDKAALVARWLPRTGPPASVYNTLGLRP